MNKKTFDIKTKPAPNSVLNNVTILENGGGAKVLKSSISSIFQNNNPLEKAGRKGYTTDLPIEHLVPFPNQPFRMYTQEKLEDLAKSIAKYGVLAPILVRPKGNGIYEILAGRNRTFASRLAGLTEINSKVIEVDDDEASIIVAEDNLQHREKLLPSEKAFAYKMQLEAIKNRERKKLSDGRITSDTEDYEDLCPEDTRQNSGEEVASKVNASRKNIYRYIRLTFLTKDLLDMVDEEIIPFKAGAEVSYIQEREQVILYQILTGGQYKLDFEKSIAMKDRAKAGKLDYENIVEILSGNYLKPRGKAKNDIVKSPYIKVFKKVQKYLDKLPDHEPVSDEKELEQVIILAIDAYVKSKSQQRNNNEA